MAFFIGALLSVIVLFQTKIMGLEDNKGFFTSLLVVIPTYYILFAYVSTGLILEEIIVSLLFIIIATIGALYSFFIIGIGLVLHGVFDLVHDSFINNPGVPNWWTLFCAGADFVLGLWILYITKLKNQLT